MTVGPTAKADESSSERDRALAEQAIHQAMPRPGSSAHGLPPGIPTDSIPGYEIIREIHRGGQGVVYQAIQKATRRKVAIKVVREGPFAGSSERARFDREVQILGQLNHPNIVAIHDSGSVAGSFYFVMDYISGHSLDAWAKSNTPSIDQILKMFTTVCEAVSAAHLRGVIHRDLKPSNIRVDGGGQPHILDFGLAKVAGEAGSASRLEMMTMTGQFIGSLPWASPEQADGTPERIDIRTDVYSLGVILYQLLTGRFPYDVVGNMRDVLDNILKAEPARPSTVRRQINNEVETIVLKCLSKDRERRYQSAGELARDIHRYLTGDPIEAKRDSGWYVISKTLRRYRPHVAVGAAFLMLLIGAAAALTYLWRDADLARRRATAAALEARDENLRANKNFDALLGLSIKLTDMDDVLKRLRGTTGLRESIGKSTPASLGLVSPRDGDDPAYLRQLAKAWQTYGDVLGELFQPNSGDHARARAAYGEAMAIRQRLLDKFPDRYESHADMAESQFKTGQLLHGEGKYRDARTSFDSALSRCDAAFEFAKSASAAEQQQIADRRRMILRAQADGLVEMSRAAENEDQLKPLIDEARSRYDQAVEYWAERLNDAPDDRRAARELGVCREGLSRSSLESGLFWSRRIKATGDQRTALADAVIMGARALGHFDATVASSETAHAQFAALYEDHPENAELYRDLQLSKHLIGWGHQETAAVYKKLTDLGDPVDHVQEREARLQKATEAFDEATRIAQSLVDSDASNLEARRDLTTCLNKSGNMLRERGMLSEAALVFERNLAMRNDLNLTDPTPNRLGDLAVAFYKCGEVDELRADRLAADKSRSQEARRLYASALVRYDNSVSHYRRKRAEGGVVSDGDIRQVEQRLAAIRAKVEGR